MFDHDAIHSAATQYVADLRQIDLDHKARVKQIRRRVLAGQVLAGGLILAGTIIANRSK